MSWILWQSFLAGNNNPLIVLFGLILLVDIAVWFSTKQLLKREKDFNGFVEGLLQVLGSWYSLGAMSLFTISWAAYDISKGKSSGALDIGISIWTMILDVLVIIGANYTRIKDRKSLKEIYNAIKELDINKKEN